MVTCYAYQDPLLTGIPEDDDLRLGHRRLHGDVRLVLPDRLLALLLGVVDPVGALRARHHRFFCYFGGLRRRRCRVVLDLRADVAALRTVALAGDDERRGDGRAR